MPTERLSMRRIRDVLRLKYAQGLSERAIARSLGLGKGTVGTYLMRARSAGLAWPLPTGLSDDDLELRSLILIDAAHSLVFRLGARSISLLRATRIGMTAFLPARSRSTSMSQPMAIRSHAHPFGAAGGRSPVKKLVSRYFSSRAASRGRKTGAMRWRQ